MQMYCPALKKRTSLFPMVYSPVTCAWCLTLPSSSFLRLKETWLLNESPSRPSMCSPMASHRRDTFSHSLAIESHTPWKDEDFLRSRVVHERLAAAYQWLTRNQRTRRPVLTFRIAGWWIVTEFPRSTNRTLRFHWRVLDVPVLRDHERLCEIRRSRYRTCTSRFSLYSYSSYHSDERYDVWNRSNPFKSINRSERVIIGMHLSSTDRQ